LIAADSSSLIAFLAGEAGADVDAVNAALLAGEFLLPPPAVSELMVKGDAKLVAALIDEAPTLPIGDGFWERVGQNRRLLLDKGLKAALGDSLIAQCCIDADVPLITRDRDYRHFERWCGLKLAL
jgi:predicted nucleic acid-binding protein